METLPLHVRSTLKEIEDYFQVLRLHGISFQYKLKASDARETATLLLWALGLAEPSSPPWQFNPDMLC